MEILFCFNTAALLLSLPRIITSYYYSLSDSDPVSAKPFSEPRAVSLQYLMSPFGYANRIHSVCLADMGNSAHTVWNTQEDKDTLLQKPVESLTKEKGARFSNFHKAGLNI